MANSYQQRNGGVPNGTCPPLRNGFTHQNRYGSYFQPPNQFRVSVGAPQQQQQMYGRPPYPNGGARSRSLFRNKDNGFSVSQCVTKNDSITTLNHTVSKEEGQQKENKENSPALVEFEHMFVSTIGSGTEQGSKGLPLKLAIKRFNSDWPKSVEKHAQELTNGHIMKLINSLSNVLVVKKYEETWVLPIATDKTRATLNLIDRTKSKTRQLPKRRSFDYGCPHFGGSLPPAVANAQPRFSRFDHFNRHNNQTDAQYRKQDENDAISGQPDSNRSSTSNGPLLKLNNPFYANSQSLKMPVQPVMQNNGIGIPVSQHDKTNGVPPMVISRPPTVEPQLISGGGLNNISCVTKNDSITTLNHAVSKEEGQQKENKENSPALVEFEHMFVSTIGSGREQGSKGLPLKLAIKRFNSDWPKSVEQHAQELTNGHIMKLINSLNNVLVVKKCEETWVLPIATDKTRGVLSSPKLNNYSIYTNPASMSMPVQPVLHRANFWGAGFPFSQKEQTNGVPPSAVPSSSPTAKLQLVSGGVLDNISDEVKELVLMIYSAGGEGKNGITYDKLREMYSAKHAEPLTGLKLASILGTTTRNPIIALVKFQPEIFVCATRTDNISLTDEVLEILSKNNDAHDFSTADPTTTTNGTGVHYEK